MLVFTFLALIHLRVHISPSIAYTLSKGTHLALLQGSALRRLPSITFEQRRSQGTFPFSHSDLLGTLACGLRHSAPDCQPYREMTAKGTKELVTASKVDAEEERAGPGDAGTKRRLEGDIIKTEEKDTHGQPPSVESKSSSVVATGRTFATGDEEEATEEPGSTKDSPVAKKRRVAAKARAKASAGKKNVTATTAPPTTTLKADEEFTALATLAAKSRKFVGAHISAAGGVHNALISCFNVKGQAFALFLKCQRKWVSPPLAETAITGFKERCDQLELDKAMQVLPHGSYLINVANPDKTKQENAYKAFLDDLQRCETLGIKLYNIHPGSTVGDCSKEEGIRNIAAAVNRAHKDTKFVVVVLENMAGQKNVIGSKFEDLRDIIDLVEDKDRVGVCLDTCHLFAAGYDIRTAEKFEKVMEDFDSIVGYKFLKGMHLNDSKSELSSGLDRHELLGKGHLGLEPFRYIMRHPWRFKDMPLVLETPDPTEGSIWKKEIKQMYSFLDEKEE